MRKSQSGGKAEGTGMVIRTKRNRTEECRFGWPISLPCGFSMRIEECLVCLEALLVLVIG